jgi:hypothetical protein
MSSDFAAVAVGGKEGRSDHHIRPLRPDEVDKWLDFVSDCFAMKVRRRRGYGCEEAERRERRRERRRTKSLSLFLSFSPSLSLSLSRGRHARISSVTCRTMRHSTRAMSVWRLYVQTMSF